MINRRHIRIKVMQSAYAMLLSEADNLNVQEKYMYGSINHLYRLYVLQFKLFLEIRTRAQLYFQKSQKRYVKGGSVWEVSDNILKNKVLEQFAQSSSLNDFEIKKQETNWQEHSEMVDTVWNAIRKEDFVTTYLAIDEPTYLEDKQFVIDVFKQIIAPSDSLYDFYESEVISWIDDIPFVNTWVVQQLQRLKRKQSFELEALYKDEDDKLFAKQLLHKTVLNFSKYEQEVISKTPNWDADRITKVDKLLMVMAIAEFLNFPSIPTKVTINEYIEIAKDYATQKSGFFINGVLDRLVVEFNNDNRIQKSGRGLL